MRWPIVRNLLFLAAIGGGFAVAGPFGRKSPEPAPEETPPPEAAPAPAPVVEPAPALFPDGLPVALQQTPEGLASISAQACNACHHEVHDNWQKSAHSQAWQSPAYQLAMSRVGDSTACKGCHLPLANQHSRLAAGYIAQDLTRPNLQANPAWAPTLMAEGVTCAACHVREGKILGRHASARAPHPVVVSDELGTPEFCASCHQLTWPEADKPFYDTYGEWKASAYATAGVRCQDCHMSPRAGQASASRFAAVADHATTADLDRALSVHVTLDAPDFQRGEPSTVKLLLQNSGAGHHIPTGSPFRRLKLTVAVVGADGKPLAPPFEHELGRVLEDAPPWRTISDTRLAAGAELELSTSFEVPQKANAQTATLEIRVQDVVGDADAEPQVVQRIPIAIL